MSDAAGRGGRLVWLDPLVAGVVFAIALRFIAGWPASASDAVDRVAFAVPIVAALIAIGVAFDRRSRGISTPAAAALASAACVAPVLWPMLSARPLDRWSPTSLGLVVATIVLATAGVVCLAARIRSDERGGATVVALVLFGMTLAAPGLIAANGSITIAQRAAPLTAIALLSVVFGLTVRNRAASAGVVAFVVVVLGAVLAAAWRWSDLPGWEAIAVAAAIPLAWAAFGLPIVPRRRRWLRVAVALAIAATPTVVAGVVANREAQRTSQSTGADEGY